MNMRRSSLPGPNDAESFRTASDPTILLVHAHEAKITMYETVIRKDLRLETIFRPKILGLRREIEGLNMRTLELRFDDTIML